MRLSKEGEKGMIWTDLTRAAYIIAEKAHAGQLDRGGAPYILHPLAVAKEMTDEDTAAVALLHDVIEDTDWTVEDLLRSGIPQRVVSAVEKLTHKDGIPYLEYVEGLKDDPIAAAVKKADLKHNCDLSRLGRPAGPKDLMRVEKYRQALRCLEEC